MADEGATPRELLLESCRRNNASLLTTVLSSFDASSTTPSSSSSTTTTPATLAGFLNTARDGLGSGCLHIAAQYGSYEVLDLLLDQEGIEIDTLEPREGDTCLHKAVRYAASVYGELRQQRQQQQQGEDNGGGEGLRIVEILIDAGCDPRIRNKGKLKPVDLADPRDEEVRAALRKAEFVLAAGDDVVRDDDDGDDGGSASD